MVFFSVFRISLCQNYRLFLDKKMINMGIFQFSEFPMSYCQASLFNYMFKTILCITCYLYGDDILYYMLPVWR